MRRALAIAVLLALLQAGPVLGGSSDLAGKKIALDPGHGGSDPGAVGYVKEADVNLDVALRARELLVQEGAQVVMTRTCDCTVSLADRVSIANNNGAHRFIAVHSNACGFCGGTGTETYYHTSDSGTSLSAQLARVVQEEMVQHLQLRDRGVKQADFYVLRNTNMPAVLVELGFVDTAADATKLASPTWRQEAARAILHAVQRHYGIAPHDPAAQPGDTTPPSTGASLSGTRGDNGWWRGAVAVSLSASDGGSGVAGTRYRVDGGGWLAYAGPFAVGGEGGHRVDYYSVDTAGNTESLRSVGFGIDTSPPSTSHALAGVEGLDGWWRSAVLVGLTASDATSGVSSTSAAVDGAWATYDGPFSLAGDGVHSLAYASRDVAGNVEPTRAIEVRVDTLPPVTTMSHGGPSHRGAVLYVSGATPFTLAAADATSGVRATTWGWRGDTQGYGGAFTLGGTDGEGTLSWGSGDRAGNGEPSRSEAVFLDNTPPSLTLQAPPEGGLVVSLEPVLLGAQADDAGSGVARVEFKVDGVLRSVDAEAPYAWAWPAGDEALGEHVLAVQAVDHLGHAAQQQRRLTTVPTSAAGVQATLARLAAGASPPDPAALAEQAGSLVQRPPRLPVVGVVAEADPAGPHARVGVTLDGAFHGVEV